MTSLPSCDVAWRTAEPTPRFSVLHDAELANAIRGDAARLSVACVDARARGFPVEVILQMDGRTPPRAIAMRPAGESVRTNDVDDALDHLNAKLAAASTRGIRVALQVILVDDVTVQRMWRNCA
jgi:hypothetical protein